MVDHSFQTLHNLSIFWPRGEHPLLHGEKFLPRRQVDLVDADLKAHPRLFEKLAVSRLLGKEGGKVPKGEPPFHGLEDTLSPRLPDNDVGPGEVRHHVRLKSQGLEPRGLQPFFEGVVEAAKDPKLRPGTLLEMAIIGDILRQEAKAAAT